MNSNEYNNLVMKTIDWFEDRHPQNVRDTSQIHLAELLPPFLKYSQNNQIYRYTTETGSVIILNQTQSSDLHGVIEIERRNALQNMSSFARGINKSRKSKKSRKTRKSRKGKKSRKSRK
jgi:hypothetical protein